MVEDDEREPSPEVPLTKTSTQTAILTKTPPAEVPVTGKELESVDESLQIIERVVSSHLGTSHGEGRVLDFDSAMEPHKEA